MSYTAIALDGIGKQFLIGAKQNNDYPTLRGKIAQFARNPFRRSASASRERFWALKDLSFDIEQGDVVGLIGHNGSGKSTLLKLLSRITEPTVGKAVLRGRVGSLLEVGAGFHAELSGRENIYLNGALLGMRHAEIDRKFDEIVEFSEVETFLDTPVKFYSSGMYTRLAFAVAAHMETEILLVDEVLAVGDAGFQAKCMGKIGDVARGGRTVLLVSHSMAAINNLCNKAVLLDHGRLARMGPTSEVTRLYLAAFARGEARVDLRKRGNRLGSSEVRIVEAATLTESGEPTTQFTSGDTMVFDIHMEAGSMAPRMHVAVSIRTLTGTPVLYATTYDDPTAGTFASDGHRVVRCVIPQCNLYPGEYQVSLWIGTMVANTVDYLEDAMTFSMNPGQLTQRGWDSSWDRGVYYVPSYWSAAPPAAAR